MNRSIAAFVTYFIVGALIAKFKMNKTGLDLIPNKSFWKDLPFLLKVYYLVVTQSDDYASFKIFFQDGLVFVVKSFLYVGNLIKGRFTNRKYSLI